MNKRVHALQAMLAVIAISLVVTLFVTGMVGGQNLDQEATVTPKPSPSTTSGAPLAQGERMPGVPERDISQYQTFPAGPNPDRQLDYSAQGSLAVEFADSLGELESYATQQINWEVCQGEVALCAKVLAPLDWENPQGPAIEIAVTRVLGGDSSRGPLFVNPGGPGQAGSSFAVNLKDRFTNFDVIGWDPRGTGESTHVVCGTGEQTDAYHALDASPDDDAEDSALREGTAAFARQCRDASGQLLDHLSTVDVVRDLDLLRHLLGAKKLNYFGVSYGTYVGATYATLFPKSSGRLILDAAVDITGQETVTQWAGFERALGNFTSWCASSSMCGLGDDQNKIASDVAAFLQGLDSSPMAVGDRQLTQSRAAAGLALFLYADEQAYRTLAAVLDAALKGNGTDLLTAADTQAGRLADGTYETLTYAFPAMICADWSDLGVAASKTDWRDEFAKAPNMAPNLGVSYDCPLWTARSGVELKLDAAGADPIVVVGTTGDSATPYENAVSMAQQLQPASLLTLEGAGHGAVMGQNTCIADAVAGFLYDGKVPEDGKRCT